MSEKRWNGIAVKGQRIQPAMSYDTVPGAAAFIWQRAGELKAPGYKRVIIAGQSWGSCVAMVADHEKDFAAEERADRAKHLDPGAAPTARLTLLSCSTRASSRSWCSTGHW
jgi:hypothetical protein